MFNCLFINKLKKKIIESGNVESGRSQSLYLDQLEDVLKICAVQSFNNKQVHMHEETDASGGRKMFTRTVTS